MAERWEKWAAIMLVPLMGGCLLSGCVGTFDGEDGQSERVWTPLPPALDGGSDVPSDSLDAASPIEDMRVLDAALDVAVDAAPDAAVDAVVDAVVDAEIDAAVCPVAPEASDLVVELCEQVELQCVFAFGSSPTATTMSCDEICEGQGFTCATASVTRLSSGCPAAGGFGLACDAAAAQGQCTCAMGD